VDPKARVKRITVALLVDGVPDASGKVVPRPAAELARIEALAREAAGLDAARGDRISVQSAPFSADAAPAEVAANENEANQAFKLPPLPILAAAGGGALLLVIGVTFLVMRARRKKAKKNAPEVLPALPLTVGQLEAQLPGSTPALALPARTRRDEAIEAATKDGLRAARVLSAWLAETPPDDAAAPNARGGA
jgi:flagellar M-ring protein FliF